jgi:peptide methionine sulfoxide reductase MsrA
MMQLKDMLIERADRMSESSDPRVQTRGAQFRQAIAAVAQADAEVARAVRAFQAGAPNVSKEMIVEGITNTQKFYTDLEIRMNLFEATGR